MEITTITKKRIIEYASQGKRFDDRDLLEYRPTSIKFGISNMAEGSAEVSMGQTKVIAGVKLAVAEPYADSEEEGNLMVTVELSPLSSENFQTGPPDVFAIEMARIIDRGIRESGIVDFKKLCIKKAELVWAVMVDIYPINDDGNLIDAAALAAVAALSSAVFPVLEGDKVSFGEFTTKHLPLTKDVPITMTFYKLENSILLDPTTREEESSDTRVSIAISEKEGKEKEPIINAMQKGGCKNAKNSPLTPEEMSIIIDTAVKEQKKIRKILEEALEKQEKSK